MKKMLPLLIFIALVGFIWKQDKTAVESGSPESSFLKKTLHVIPSETLREQLSTWTGGKNTFTQRWEALTDELFTPLSQGGEGQALVDFEGTIRQINMDLAGLKTGSKEEQRLAYLGEKFNKSLLLVNSSRQQIQAEAKNGMIAAKEPKKGEEGQPKKEGRKGRPDNSAERSKIFLQAAFSRWDQIRMSSKSSLLPQLQILKEAEAAAR